MQKSTLAALAACLIAIANELNPEGDAVEGNAPAAPGEPAKRRGRPPGSANAPAEPAPAEPAPSAAAAPAPATGGKTYAELQDVIRPLVEDGRGEEVKKVIAKYGASLKEIPADKSAAFVKDIEALSY